MAGRTIPPMANEAPGNFITSALWNTQINNGLYSFSITPPVAVLTATTAQSIATGSSGAVVAFTSAVTDSEGGWSSSLNPDRYTVQTPGRYLAIVTASLANGSSTDTTSRGLHVKQNATIMRASNTPANTSNFWEAQVTTGLLCAVGDYIQVEIVNGYTSALSTFTSHVWSQPTLELYWIGEN